MSEEFNHKYRRFTARKNAAALVFQKLRNREWTQDEGIALFHNEYEAPTLIDTDRTDFADRWDSEMQRILSSKPYTQYFDENFAQIVTSANHWDVVRAVEFEIQHHKLSDSVDYRYLINILHKALDSTAISNRHTIQAALDWLELQEESIRKWEMLQKSTQLICVKYINRSSFPSQFLTDIERLPIELTLQALDTEYRLDFRFEKKECEYLLDILSRQLTLTPDNQKLVIVSDWIKAWLIALLSLDCTEYLVNSDGRKGYYNKAVAERLLKSSPFHLSSWKLEHSTDSVERSNLSNLLTDTQVTLPIAKQELPFKNEDQGATISVKPKTSRKPSEVELRNVTIEEIRTLFERVKMGLLYNKPGEWAAAFRALSVGGYLIGVPAAIDRWAISTQFKGRSSKSIVETLKKRKEHSEPEDFKGDEKIIFKLITQGLKEHANRKRQ